MSPEAFAVSFQLAATLGQLPKAANDNGRACAVNRVKTRCHEGLALQLADVFRS